MSDTSPHAIQSDEPIPVKQPDGSGATACYIIKPEYIDQLLERIRQLEIERDDYKAYTVATMNGWRFWQKENGLWIRWQGGDGPSLGPHPTWWMAARAAMKEVRNASAGKAAEYLEGKP